MNEKLANLVKEICIFFKKEDYYKLEKIVDGTKNNFPEFFPLMSEFDKHYTFEKIASNVVDVFTLGGAPFILLGKKAEDDEKKVLFLEEAKNIKTKIKELIDNSSTSKETEFLNFLYANI